ncbi:unnamed protein product, partial [Heterotrigona itama]
KRKTANCLERCFTVDSNRAVKSSIGALLDNGSVKLATEVRCRRGLLGRRRSIPNEPIASEMVFVQKSSAIKVDEEEQAFAQDGRKATGSY